MKKLGYQAFLVLAGTLAITAAAWAKSADTPSAGVFRGVPVSEQPRPEFTPPGISVGPFTLMPELDVALTYNDNIFTTKNDRTYDWITTVAPRIGMRSGWGRHALGLTAGLEGGIYSRESDENYIDSHALLDGRFDMWEASFLEGRAGFFRLHEARGDPDVLLEFDEPVVYNRVEAGLGALLKRGRAALHAGGEFVNLDFNSVGIREGASRDLDHRNRDMYSFIGRLSYEATPYATPFILYRHDQRRYENSELGMENRDSDGYRAGAGMALNLRGVLIGELFGGYFSQEYDETGEDISGPWYGMSLLINVTENRSIQGFLEKEIKETTMPGARGIDALNARLSIDSALPGNLLETIYFDFAQYKYEGEDLEASIENRYYTAGYRITYFWRPTLSIRFEYSHTLKEADDRRDKFNINRLQAALTGRF